MRLAKSNERTRVVLVGYEDQENLGVRYIAARLKQAGHVATVIAYSKNHWEIAEKVERERPHIVGLSLIFQSMFPEFNSLAALLRGRGMCAHLTIGGHFPSFKPETVLKGMPFLDSVVIHEGEETLLALADAINAGTPWKSIPGIAFIDNGRIVKTPPRSPLNDLDLLPWPDREDKTYVGRLPKAAMLGSRGCPWHCSFCSITNFYAANGTKGRRLRNPSDIANEMTYLWREKGVRVILWQDDEFLGGGKLGVKWAHELVTECIKRGLHRELRWKISCRPDSVTYENLTPLVEAGMRHVYLGVESGDRQSLRHLNKRISPEDHFKAKEVITGHGLTFDFGFMLMEPWSTLETVRNNVTFLRDFSGDGSSIAGFCRMLPYAGTAAKEKLMKEGRLRLYHDCIPDYSFLDDRLDAFYNWAHSTFHGRNFGEVGTVSLMRAAFFEASVELPDSPGDSRLQREIRELAAVSNNTMVDILELSLDHIEGNWPFDPNKDETLAGLTGQARREEELTRHHAMGILAVLQK